MQDPGAKFNFTFLIEITRESNEYNQSTSCLKLYTSITKTGLRLIRNDFKTLFDFIPTAERKCVLFTMVFTITINSILLKAVYVKNEIMNADNSKYIYFFKVAHLSKISFLMIFI